MKKYFLAMVLIAAAVSTRGAEIIAQWNFNSVPPDAAVGTGTNVPSVGAGSLSRVGGTTNTYATGHTDDPAPAADNSGINLATFPPQATSNKTAGIRFAVSTEGFRNITIAWAQRVSNTGSKYYRFFYSLDGINFVESTNVIALPAPNAFLDQFVNLSAVAGATNNPNFAFQIVSEFEGSAIGTVNNNYVTATNSTYTGNGTARFDMMTISGDSSGVVNAAPTITPITNITMRANSTYSAVSFTIGDAETPVDSLTLDKSSSNPALLPTSGIVLEGTGSNRTVTLMPLPDQAGSANITLTVIDAGGKSNSTVFAVNVIPTNTAPTISVIFNQGTVVDTATAAIPFTIGDAEMAASNLTVTAISGNTTLLPQAGVVLGGSNANRTITLTPAAGQLGNGLVTISVSDGLFTTNRTFVFSVVPSAGTLLYEPFNYADGPLVTNSIGLWQTHGGINGELDTVGQILYVTAENSEDVNARLRGEPYTPVSGTNLYYSLRVSAYNLPTVLGDYFAHFKDNGSTFRAKLFVSTTNAALGSYRIGVANGASFPTNAGYAEVPIDIGFDQTNLVVVRYNVGTGVSTLWLNPVGETSTSYTASDLLGSTNSVTQFAIRESRFQGDLYIDDIRVATAFDEVLGRLPQAFRLRIRHSDVLWPVAASAAGFVLEWTSDLSAPNWQPLSPSGTEGDQHVLNFANPAGNVFFRLRKGP